MLAGRPERGLEKIQFLGNLDDFKQGNRLWFPRWHLESLMNRYLAFQSDGKRGSKTLNILNWAGFSKIINALNNLENVEAMIDVDEDDIAHSLQRLFWPQYSWQTGYVTRQKFCRSWNLYGGQQCQRAFFEKHGVELHEFLRISFMVYAAANINPAVDERALIKLDATLPNVMNSVNVISKDLKDLRKISKALQSEMVNASFNRSAIRETPVIRIIGPSGRLLLVPLPDLVIARVTDALYYDIVGDGAARNEAGVAFENLSHEMLTARLSDGWKIVRPELEVGDGCCDLAILSPRNEYSALIECKARRIGRRVSAAPVPWAVAKSDFTDLIKGVTQIWRTAYLIEGKKDEVIGTVLTLDPWMHLAPYIEDLIIEARRLAEQRFGRKYLETPIGFACSDDFETVSGALDTPSLIGRLKDLCNSEQFGHVLRAAPFGRDDSEVAMRSDPYDYNERLLRDIPWWGKFGKRTDK
jgi:hypothetical protein